MTKPSTYGQLAAALGVELCVRDLEECPQRHYPGVLIRIASSVIAHWSDRRLNRRGAFNFIRQVKAQRLPPGMPKWMQIYETTTQAVEEAEGLGYRIPRWYTENERRRVRFLLQDAALRDRNSTARRAWKWAKPEQ